MDIADVARHYGHTDVLAAYLGALRAAGEDPDSGHVDPTVLVPAEEFHTFGAAATTALAKAAAIADADRVLDIGCGVGGPARHLAREYGCRVTGLDLTPELVAAASELTRLVGLDDRVDIHLGNACELPFDDGSFDVAWTQHASMNIPDKAALFSEARRVLAPGGRLAFFDILAGPSQPIHFPVPWADDASVSFLATPEETRALVESSGMAITMWDDLTGEAAAFYSQLAAGTAAVPGPLGLHLLIPDMATKGANLRRNVEEGRMVLVRCVAAAT